MKRLSLQGALWLNRRELAKIKYAQLNNAFVGYNGIFEHFQIGVNGIREIQTFSWDKSNETCDDHQYTDGLQFRTVSTEYLYEFDQIDGSVHFQLQFHRKFIGKEVEYSIYVKILPKTIGIESVTTEMDIICHCDGKVYRSLMRKQKLLPNGSAKGVMVFRSENVNDNSSITWKFAIRMEPKQSQLKIKDRFPVWEQSLDTIDDHFDQEFYDELKEQYDALTDSYDALIKKHQETLLRFDDIKTDKDEEIERLREQLRQKDETVQEGKGRLKISKRDPARKRLMNSIIRLAT